MNKYIIITARCNSTRLKNKVLSKITKKYLAIDIIIRRAKKIQFPICLATSTNKDDDKLVNYVKKYDIKIFRGNENNKISRWISCIKKYNIDCVALIDGDDLAFDYMAYKRYLKKFNTNKNLQVFKFPENIVTGTFTYIFASNALKLMYAKSSKLKKIDVIEFFLKYLKNIEEIRLPKILLDKKSDSRLIIKKILNFL